MSVSGSAAGDTRPCVPIRAESRRSGREKRVGRHGADGRLVAIRCCAVADRPSIWASGNPDGRRGSEIYSSAPVARRPLGVVLRMMYLKRGVCWFSQNSAYHWQHPFTCTVVSAQRCRIPILKTRSDRSRSRTDRPYWQCAGLYFTVERAAEAA